MEDKGYKEFIAGLLKEEHFDRLLNDIKTSLLNKIAATQPADSSTREELYFKIQGVDAVKKEAVLAVKRKITGGNE